MGERLGRVVWVRRNEFDTQDVIQCYEKIMENGIKINTILMQRMESIHVREIQRIPIKYLLWKSCVWILFFTAKQILDFISP